jgi:hypothetical protein
MIDRAAAPSGILRVDIWRHGRLIERSDRPNLIVGGHGPIQAALLGGAVAGKSIAQVGFGSSQAAADVGNSALSPDAYFKALDSISYPAPNQVAFAFSLGLFEALGLMLSEYGLLTGDSTLYARQVRTSPLLKDSSLQLAATWTITL